MVGLFIIYIYIYNYRKNPQNLIWYTGNKLSDVKDYLENHSWKGKIRNKGENDLRKKGEETETQTEEAARIVGGKKTISKDVIEESFPELRPLCTCKLIF